MNVRRKRDSRRIGRLGCGASRLRNGGGRLDVVGTALVLLAVAITPFLAGCDVSFGGVRVPGDSGVPPAVQWQGDTLLWGAEIKPEALAMINRSRGFCHLTMYELADADILDALSRAAARGVDVEVVVDATEPHTLATGLPFLRSHHIKVRTLVISGGISHIKSLVTEDGSGMHALLGGMNFGEYSWQNHDAAVYMSRANDSFEGLFEQDYARADGDDRPALQFGPPLVYDTGIEPALLAAVSDARSAIDIEAFAFTSQDLITALGAAVSRGVVVHVLLDPVQPYNHKTARRLQAEGVQVRYYAPYAGEYLHAKIVAIDGGRYVFVGSANFSYHGFSVNHEGDVELTGAYPFGQSIDADETTQFARGSDVAGGSDGSGDSAYGTGGNGGSNGGGYGSTSGYGGG
ncbi:MAG: phospholipase D-like domain-containing protein [Firmicutes bacterium]|nr:phospholipase D-like domain-containing protein [Bacillota bacterium]